MVRARLSLSEASSLVGLAVAGLRTDPERRWRPPPSTLFRGRPPLLPAGRPGPRMLALTCFPPAPRIDPGAGKYRHSERSQRVRQCVGGGFPPAARWAARPGARSAAGERLQQRNFPALAVALTAGA